MICPLCKKTQSISGTNNVSECFLRIDLDTKQFISEDNCIHEMKTWVCFYNDCKKNNNSCLNCLSKIHENCNEETFENIANIKFDIKTTTSKLVNLFLI